MLPKFHMESGGGLSLTAQSATDLCAKFTFEGTIASMLGVGEGWRRKATIKVVRHLPQMSSDFLTSVKPVEIRELKLVSGHKWNSSLRMSEGQFWGKDEVNNKMYVLRPSNNLSVFVNVAILIVAGR